MTSGTSSGHAEHPQREPDDHGVDGRDRDRAAHVVHQRLPGGRAGQVGPAAGCSGAEEAGQPGPDPVTVLEQEERDEQHEHQAGQDLQEDLAAGHHGARDQRLVLLEVLQRPVGQALDARVPDVERRPGQRRLQRGHGVPELVDQVRVVRRGPGHGQGARPGQDGHRDAAACTRWRPGRAAEPPEPGQQGLQQRGEQQRGHARQHHQAQHAGHPERQVDDDADEQQPPRPARGPLQPAGAPRAARLGRLVRRVHRRSAASAAVPRSARARPPAPLARPRPRCARPPRPAPFAGPQPRRARWWRPRRGSRCGPGFPACPAPAGRPPRLPA